jgi:hypothetical protein
VNPFQLIEIWQSSLRHTEKLLNFIIILFPYLPQSCNKILRAWRTILEVYKKEWLADAVVKDIPHDSSSNARSYWTGPAFSVLVQVQHLEFEIQ